MAGGEDYLLDKVHILGGETPQIIPVSQHSKKNIPQKNRLFPEFQNSMILATTHDPIFQ